MPEMDAGRGDHRDGTPETPARTAHIVGAISDDDPLLLHSLAEFRELIFTCLEVAGARTVAEVGAEDGVFSRELLAWAEGREGKVFCIDPQPGPALVALSETSAVMELVRLRSVDALKDMPPCDAYLIDGDHNYHTVSTELQLIEERQAAGGAEVLVFLHDLGWPAGRRDMYYSPSSLPPGAVHPHTYDKGVTTGFAGVVADGFSGQGQFAWARLEGGPANGVRTAVEDFLETRPHLALAVVPSVFGLGVLYQAGAPYAEEMAAVLGAHDRNRMLERLEENRLALYLRVIELQEALATAYRDLETSGLRVRDVEVENRALWARAGELEDQLATAHDAGEAMVAELEVILRSRPFVLAEQLSRLRALRGGAPGLSRKRLRTFTDGG